MIPGLEFLVQALREAGGTLTDNDLRAQLSAALKDAVGPDNWAWFVAAIPESDTTGAVVYEQAGKLWRCAYSIEVAKNKRSTTLQMSKAQQVMMRTSFDVVGGTTVEAARGDRQLNEPGVVFVREAAEAGSVGKYLIKIIAPGQGSSAFYPEEVLKRDGPKVFKAGTHMYWNHPTAAEEASRPEGDLSLLSGVLTSNAYWDGAGPEGAGLYAEAKVFSDYAGQVEDKKKHIGVSIRAYGIGDTGKDGVFRLTKFTREAESVDFVTRPGAGGRIVSLTESGGAAETGAIEMDKTEVQALIEESMKPLQMQVATLTESEKTLKAENARLSLRANLAEARNYIAGKLRESKLPGAAKLRIVDTVLAAAVPVTESGSLDSKALDEAIKAATDSETAYLAEVAGPTRVVGMGGEPATEGKEVSEAEFNERMAGFAKSQGLSDKTAAVFAAGRN